MKYIIILAIIAIFIVIAMCSYIKAPPDCAYIISGIKKKAKVIIGKAGIRLPFFERLDKITLQLMQVDVKTTNSVPTAEYINVNVDAVANIKIGSSDSMIQKASQNFLNKPIEYIIKVAQEVLEGNMREIVGKMKLEEMVSDRIAFSKNVLENAVPDLEAMGLEIVSFNIQNFTDTNGVIEDLGIDNVTKIKKNAAIVKAESERDISIANSKAKQDANDARVASETQIAKRNNDLDIQRADLKVEADKRKADADAAYHIQEQIQRKSIEVASVDADIARQEREVKLKEQQVSVTEQQLNAEVKKQAEAQLYATQKQSEADLYKRQKAAEASKFERMQEAEANKYEQVQKAEGIEKEADAEKYRQMQEAEAIKAKGLAEAEAIKAKGIAEAEAIEKKAEAMAKMGQASILEMYFNALPDVVRGVATPLASVDKITMYGDGNSTKLISDITNSVSKAINGISQATGFDIQGIIAKKLSDIQNATDSVTNAEDDNE